jgi:AcrR family transcriptional regulator
VLDAALDLLSDGTPYTELAMQRIAAHSGVGRSTVYSLFPDKSRLLIALAERITNAMSVVGVSWWDSNHESGLADLEAAMSKVVTEYRKNQYVLLALVEVAGYDRHVELYMFTRVNAFADLVADRLTTAQRLGTVSRQFDPTLTARVLTWTVEHSIAMHCRTNPSSADRELAQTLARVVWYSIYGDKPGPE